jgi:hypothetical protein
MASKLPVNRGGGSSSSSAKVRIDFLPPREREADSMARVKMTAVKKPDERTRAERIAELEAELARERKRKRADIEEEVEEEEVEEEGPEEDDAEDSDYKEGGKENPETFSSEEEEECEEEEEEEELPPRKSVKKQVLGKPSKPLKKDAKKVHPKLQPKKAQPKKKQPEVKPKLIKWTDGEELLLAQLNKKEHTEQAKACNRGKRVMRQGHKKWLAFENEFHMHGYSRDARHIGIKWHNMKTDYQ